MFCLVVMLNCDKLYIKYLFRCVNHKDSFISHSKTNTVFPNSYNPGIQNMYCCTICMIVFVLCSVCVLGATCVCREWSRKGKWILIVPYIRKLIFEGQNSQKAI